MLSTTTKSKTQLLITKETKIFICKLIDKTMKAAPASVWEIQKRAQLTLPLLKHITRCIKSFKEAVYFFKRKEEEFKEIMSMVNVKESFSEFIKKMKSYIGCIELNLLVKNMRQYIECQFVLERILSNSIKMSHIFKSKGRRMFNRDLKVDEQEKILKYINLMVKPNFIETILGNLEINELIKAIQTMELQRDLYLEFKKHTLEGFENLMPFDSDEFKKTYDKWKQSTHDINKCVERIISEQKANRQQDVGHQEIHKLLGKLQNLLRVVEERKCLEQYFEVFRSKASAYFKKEFNEKIEIVMEYKH